MKNDGKEAERAFERHWSAKGHVQRLRDRKDLMALNPGVKNISDFKKPSDFLVSSPVDPLHYAEVKSTLKGVSFPFGAIQDGQHQAAIREAKRGSHSYQFYIFSYELGQWFVMSCLQYSSLIEDGKRSIKFKDLQPWKI